MSIFGSFRVISSLDHISITLKLKKYERIFSVSDSYQYTRTIRFKLDPCDNALSEEVQDLKKRGDSIDEICKFYNTSKELIEHLEKYLYEPQDKQKTVKQDQNKPRKFFKDSLEIKTQFLKRHTSNYYEWCNQQGQSIARAYKLCQFGYSHELFTDFFLRWKELNLKTDELIKRFQNINDPEKKPRRSEFALLISQFKKRENLAFIRDFVDLSQDKETEDIKGQLKNTFEDLSESLKFCERSYLPSQTAGIEVARARATLNYHTINKKPKDYPEEIQKKENELKQNLEKNPDAICKKIRLNDKKCIDIIREFVIKRIFKDPNKLITLDSLYKEIKSYKAKEKSEFKEAVDKGLNFSDIKENHLLFICKPNEFEEYVKQTKKIKDLSDQINKLDKQSNNYYKRKKEFNGKIKEIKQKGGNEFFRDRGGNNQYKKLCDFYKHVSVERGKILAQVKCLKKDKIESQLLSYWALILEKQNYHYLILIPKINRKKAFDKLKGEKKLPKTNGVSSIRLHYFKSLTLRALKKLCFGTDGNTFAREVNQELKNQYQSKYDNIRGAFSLKDFTEKDTVKFYQAILKTNYVKEKFDIEDFQELKNLVANSSIESLEQFQVELEKICYIKHILANEDLEKCLLNDCQARLLKITSYDLRRNKNCKGKDKSHTQIWKQFWSDKNKSQNYPVRLNPELKIYWREAKENRVRKYGKDSKLYNPNKNNRFLNSQFTLVTTFNKNAINRRIDLSFTDSDKLAKGIDKFNKRFNEIHAKNLHQTCFYGIDRGNTELATLMICQFPNKSDQSHFPKFSVYRLKDEYLDFKKGVIKNVSDIINKDDYFEEKKTSSIDLTMAKLINGKIVENGDILSYLKLKKLNAKRRLYEHLNNIAGESKSPIYFKESDQVFYLHTKHHDPKIYFYRPNLEQVNSKDQIEEMLNDYLKDLRSHNQERDILTIEKINHLRDALASNMIGVINHLYKNFLGMIALENLNESDIQSHFMKSNENISRRLEWRLYNKFQTQCLVPPQIKETILIRQTKSINQFGLIHFVPKEYTSQTCPQCSKIVTYSYENNQVCDEKYLNKNKNKFSSQKKEEIKNKNKKLKKDYEKNKFGKNRFKCSHCDFDTRGDKKGLDSLNTSDTVASFNIAQCVYKHLSSLPKNHQNNSQRRDSRGKKQRHNRHNDNKFKNHTKQKQKLTHQPFKNLDAMMKQKENHKMTKKQ